ncbi:uncharacterized protein LTR77_000813 [Saxophila tyrrhenica]|uniref:Uncharacterized protein n=1 Tax=Saxophila tyrrhenica TaxID=1690608 RepID=A0AAV9PRM0_9PEZI|nr:hypothetical protein LTR77_000813 [Saxophila tyrrhenica]
MVTASGSSAPVLSSAASSNSAPAPSSTTSPNDRYLAYCGDGSTSAGWPSTSEWQSFDYLFTSNTPSMKIACDTWGVPNDSPREIASLRSAILSVANLTSIDARFILAIIMQESSGCVRVITTAWSHTNPGLMQSFNGTGTCNLNSANINIPGVDASGKIWTPCPAERIEQQVLDGTNGTIWGPGLRQDFEIANANATDEAQAYYRTARIYNGGRFVASDLSQPCCTTSYVSDIANRLMGWVHAPREFVCG